MTSRSPTLSVLRERAAPLMLGVLVLAVLPACGDSGGRTGSWGATRQAVVASSADQVADQALSFRMQTLAMGMDLSGTPTESFSPVIASGAADLVNDGQRIVPADNATRSVAAALPSVADGAFSVDDTTSGMALSVRMASAQPVVGAVVRGMAVYADALGSGSHVLEAVLSDGVEDYTIMPDASRTEVTYDVALAGVAGLRLVADTLEFVDASGNPRLRLERPYVVDSKGEMRFGRVEIQGCAYDTDPAPPWGRAVVAPGSASCNVTVRWSGEALAYPILVDPSWHGTGSLSPRAGHSMTKWHAVATDYVELACGGIQGTSFLATCQYYSEHNGTWASAASLSYGRAYFVMADASDTCTLGSGSCPSTDATLVVGGWAAASPCPYTSTDYQEVFSWSSYAWTASQTYHRQISAAAANDDTGKLLVVGGFEGQSSGGTCITVYYSGSTPEYDFINTTWNSRAALPTGHLRAYHTATALGSSQPHNVLVVGGHDNSTVRSDAYYYHPADDTWNTAGTSLAVYSHTATLLTAGTYAGQVLVAGGADSYGDPIATIQKYSTSSGWSTSFASMDASRAWHSAVRLSSGNSIVWIGGVYYDGGYVARDTAYEWPSATGTTMSYAREMFPATLTNSGDILVAGGYRPQVPDMIGYAELYY